MIMKRQIKDRIIAGPRHACQIRAGPTTTNPEIAATGRIRKLRISAPTRALASEDDRRPSLRVVSQQLTDAPKSSAEVIVNCASRRGLRKTALEATQTTARAKERD